MRHVKRGLAVLLALLLVVPGSPVAMGNVLRSEAAGADAVLEEESSGLETESIGLENVDTDSLGTGTEESDNKGQGEADDTPEGILSDEIIMNPSAPEENASSLKTGDDVMKGESANAEEEDIEPDVNITTESATEDSSLGKVQPETELQEEMIVDAQTLEENLPVAYAANVVASGAEGNLTWTLDSDGLLTVSGTGDYGQAPYENSNLWKDYIDSVVSAKVDVTGMTSAYAMFYRCHNLTSVDLSGFDTSNMTRMDSMFAECSSLVSVDLSCFNTSNVTEMSGMFAECSSLVNLDLSGFDTSNVTRMNGMFGGCCSLTSLDLGSFNTSNVTDMENMFYRCSSLTNLVLNDFITSNVTNMMAMFSDCKSLSNLDLSGFNTSNVTTMRNMFSGCSSLSSLDLSSFSTGNVTDMWGMFWNCSSLVNLDLSSFDTSNVTVMMLMFDSCTSLTTLDISNFNTENVTDLDYMLENCSSLQTLHAPGKMGNATTDLPGVYAAPNGKQTRELTADYAGVTLSKIEEEHHWDAYKVVVEPYETPEIGQEASFKVTVTNSTDRTLFTRWINHWYYRETGNSETYPGVEFGSLLSEAGKETATEDIIFAPGESRVFKLVGVMPDTWNDKSEILLVAYGYDVNEAGYVAHGQGGYSHTETRDYITSSDYQEIQGAITEESIKTIDYVLSDGQGIPQEAQKEIFAGLQGSDKTLSIVFRDNQGEEVYRWTFEGSKITDPNKTVEFQIIVDAREPEVLAAIPEDMQKVDLAFINEGVLPGVANIKVRVQSYFQADRLYLYYYNQDKGILELVDDNVAFNGVYASFFLDHNSDYVLTAQMLQNLLPQKPGTINRPVNPGSSNKPTTPESVRPDDNAGNSAHVDENPVESQESTSLLRHIVVKGDTLSRIARLYHTTIPRLMSLNPAIKNPNLIYIGQIILVDGRVESSSEDTGTGLYHIIRRGDSFYRISRMYGIPLKELMLMNPKLSAQRYIFPGQRMLIKYEEAKMN